jgi:CheY-like chemotaxis protein
MPPTTVVVVEGTNTLRKLLGELLDLYGYAVLTAASVPEAEAIRQGMGLGGLDLVITDLRLTCVPQAWERRWARAVLPFHEGSECLASWT